MSQKNRAKKHQEIGVGLGGPVCLGNEVTHAGCCLRWRGVIRQLNLLAHRCPDGLWQHKILAVFGFGVPEGLVRLVCPLPQCQ